MRQNTFISEAADLQKNLPEKSEECQSALTDEQRRLVEEHLPLAYASAWHLQGCGVPLDDLRQEACLGLCDAARRYDASVGTPFAAYARHWCRKRTLLAVWHHGSPVRLPEDERPQARFYSLNAEDDTRDDDDDTRADRLMAAPSMAADDEDQLRKAQTARIDDALQCLTPREQTVVRLFHGFDYPRLSMAEIAAALGFSKPRVSVIYRHALGHLHEALAARPLADYLTRWL